MNYQVLKRFSFFSSLYDNCDLCPIHNLEQNSCSKKAGRSSNWSFFWSIIHWSERYLLCRSFLWGPFILFASLGGTNLSVATIDCTSCTTVTHWSASWWSAAKYSLRLSWFCSIACFRKLKFLLPFPVFWLAAGVSENNNVDIWNNDKHKRDEIICMCERESIRLANLAATL